MQVSKQRHGAPTPLFGRTPNEASIKMRYSSEKMAKVRKLYCSRGGEMDLAPDCYGGFIHALTRDSQQALDALTHEKQKNNIFSET